MSVLPNPMCPKTRGTACWKQNVSTINHDESTAKEMEISTVRENEIAITPIETKTPKQDMNSADSDRN